MRLITVIVFFLCFCMDANTVVLTEKQLNGKKDNDNSKFETIALKYLGLEENDCAMHLIVQKKLPYADQTVIVIPEYITESRNEFDEFDVNLHILLIDTTSEKVISYYPDEFVEISDAIKLGSISIDTGLFILNEEYRAFGIVVHHNNFRRHGHYTSSTISLFIQKNKTLQMVLDSLITNYTRGEYSGCEGDTETMKSVLIISDKQTNNFKNIIVKNTENHTFFERDKGITIEEEFEDYPCIEREENFTNQYTLKYVNGRYQKIN